MDIAGGQLQGDDLIVGVEDEVQLEAEEPAHRGLAALGQTGKDLVPANAMIIADRQGGGVDVINPVLVPRWLSRKNTSGTKTLFCRLTKCS